ncbi:MAG: hypothetical protein ACYSTI_12555 [Planctomycetota bacterium]|jgi:hypothetical protein
MVITSITLAGVAGAGIYSIILHLKTFKLQRYNLQVHLFNELSKRINEPVGNEPYQSEKEELEHGYIRLYSAFEYLAFYANRNFLSPEMKSYYKSFIEGYNLRIKKESISAIKYFKKQKKQQPDLFSELRKYVKDLPF